MRVVGSLATKYAPPFSLILHYFISSVITLFLFSFFLLFNSGLFFLDFLDLKFVGSVHFYILGFIMMIMIGALYQLIPVALEIPVFSFKLGYIQFYIYLFGLILFLISFINTNLFYFSTFGGTLLFISFTLFIANFLLSLKNLEKIDITVIFLIFSVLCLLIGVIIGFLMILNFHFNLFQFHISLLKAHIVLTVFGFILNVIIGIGMILFPMFSVSHKFKNIYVKTAFFFIFLGILSFFILSFINENISKIGLIFIYIGIIFYLLQVVEIYRNKPKKKSDFPLKVMFFSHLFLLLSLFFSFYSLRLSGLILIMGFYSILIFGSLYKILPFLTWFHRFSSLVGIEPVPTLGEMLPKKAPKFQIMFHSLGLVSLSIYLILKLTIFYYISSLFFILSSTLLLFIFFFIITYRRR